MVSSALPLRSLHLGHKRRTQPFLCPGVGGTGTLISRIPFQPGVFKIQPIFDYWEKKDTEAACWEEAG